MVDVNEDLSPEEKRDYVIAAFAAGEIAGDAQFVRGRLSSLTEVEIEALYKGFRASGECLAQALENLPLVDARETLERRERVTFFENITREKMIWWLTGTLYKWQATSLPSSAAPFTFLNLKSDDLGEVLAAVVSGGYEYTDDYYEEFCENHVEKCKVQVMWIAALTSMKDSRYLPGSMQAHVKEALTMLRENDAMPDVVWGAVEVV